MDFLFVISGLVLLFLGGEFLVRGSVSIARHLGLSSLLIGIVIVGFGTSMPELLVSVKAVLTGSSDIALGNVVGSNIANTLLILAVASLLTPIRVYQRSALRDALIMTLAATLLFGLVQSETIGRVSGVAMLLLLVVYLTGSYWLERQQEAAECQDISLRPWLAGITAICGVALLAVGADLLVTGAASIARDFGVPEAVIGLTLVAVGTSLPELAAAIVAAIRKHPDVVLGNVMGSNIFNVLGILGTTAVITPIEISARFRTFDVPLMLSILVALWVMLLTVKAIPRTVGLIMLAGYAAYTAFLYL